MKPHRHYITYKDETGHFHRDDGPAIVSNNGDKRFWWKNGIRISKHVYDFDFISLNDVFINKNDDTLIYVPIR